MEVMRPKSVQVYNSPCSKIGFFHSYHHVTKQMIIDTSEEETHEIRRRPSQTSEELKDNEAWKKLRKTMSRTTKANRNEGASFHVTDQIIDPVKQQFVQVVKSTTGVQTISVHCTGCREHFFGKEIGLIDSEANPEVQRVGTCDVCKKKPRSVGEEEKIVNDQEYREPEEVPEDQRLDHCQDDKVENTGNHFINKLHEVDGDSIDVHNTLDHPGEVLDNCDVKEEVFEQDKNTILETDKERMWYSTFGKNMAGFWRTKKLLVMFVFFFVLVMSCTIWRLHGRDDFVNKYIRPILNYILPNQRKTAKTEELDSFLGRCFEYLFSVTYTRF